MINYQEKLALDRQFEQERYEIARQAIEDRAALMAKDPNYDKVAYQKLQDQLLAIDRKHALDKRAIENAAAKDSMAPMMAMAQTMKQSFSQAMAGMLTGAMTLRQGLNNIFQSVLSSFIQNMVTKPLADFAMSLIQQTALYQAFFGTKKTLEATDAATQAATQKALGVTGVLSNASLAAAAAMASVAAIPFYGWAMAPAVGAETYATAMAFLPSAEGGWDIPSGATGLMRYHEEEMMLPKEHANTIRRLAGNEESGGATNGTGLAVHIHAMDSRDVARALKQGGALHKVLKDYERRGVIKPV